MDAGREAAPPPCCVADDPLPLGEQVERGILVRSSHARREENMWGFAQAALDLLAECVAEAQAQAEAGAGAEAAARTPSSSAATAAAAAPPPPPPPPLLLVSEDRYGGVEVSVREGGELELSAFVAELHAALESWHAAGKRGVWLRLSSRAHGLVSAAVSAGFEYHHATPHHLQLTRWLPQGEPSPLPRYAPRADRPQPRHAPELATSRATLIHGPNHVHAQPLTYAHAHGVHARAHTHVSGTPSRRSAWAASCSMRRAACSWCRSAHAEPMPCAHAMHTRGASVQVCSCGAYTVQERVSPSPRMQGSWKLPGGLAEPGEQLAPT